MKWDGRDAGKGTKAVQLQQNCESWAQAPENMDECKCRGSSTHSGSGDRQGQCNMACRLPPPAALCSTGCWRRRRRAAPSPARFASLHGRVSLLVGMSMHHSPRQQCCATQQTTGVLSSDLVTVLVIHSTFQPTIGM